MNCIQYLPPLELENDENGTRCQSRFSLHKSLQDSFEIHIAISTLEKERIFIDKMSLFPRRQFFPHLKLFILPGEEMNHNICSEATTDSITDYG